MFAAKRTARIRKSRLPIKANVSFAAEIVREKLFRLLGEEFALFDQCRN